MKKRILVLLIIMLMCMESACSNPVSDILYAEPEVKQIQKICKLATMKCYYHNVAKADKKAKHFWQKDRKYWIEYGGWVKVGIDVSQIHFDVDGNNISISIPDAEVLNSGLDDSFEKKYISSDEGLFSNHVSAKEESEAIGKAQKDMKKETEKNTSLMNSAQERAKKLIEEYVNGIGEMTNQDYRIIWK